MAAPLRVTEEPARSVIAVLGRGPFGTRVCEILTQGLPCSVRAGTDDVAAAFTPRPGAVVVALWRPDLEICETADEWSFRLGVPWLPVVMECNAIRIGPMTHPPAGPCFKCYRRRRAQHDGDGWATAALDAAYRSGSTAGPGGYLPHHARLAAAVTGNILRGLNSLECDAAGQVTTIRLSSDRLGVSRVIPCYGCARCSAREPAQTFSSLGVLSHDQAYPETGLGIQPDRRAVAAS